MAAVINDRDVSLQAATPRVVPVNLGSTVNVDGSVAGQNAATVVNNAATAAAHAASTGNPHGVTLTQIAGDLDDIADGSSYFRTNANQVSGAGRAFNALDSSSEYIKSLKSTKLTLAGTAPSTGWVGDSNGIRMYQAGVLKVNIPVSGDPSFTGDITGGSTIDITGAGRFQGNDAGIALVVNSSLNATVRAIDAYAAGPTGVAIVGTATASSQSGISGLATSVNAKGVTASNTAGGTALQVTGKMTINNTTLVSNLNADMVDGKHATSLCSIVVPEIGSCTVAGNGFVLISNVTSQQVRGDNSNGLIIETVSDQRLKQDIEPEKLGIEFINQLSPKTFRMRSKPKIKMHGFVSQDLIPLVQGQSDALLSLNDDGMYSTDYVSLIGPIVKSIQQLSDQLNQLKKEVKNAKKA